MYASPFAKIIFQFVPLIHRPGNSTNAMNCTIKKKKATYTSPDASIFEPDGSDFLAFLAGM